MNHNNTHNNKRQHLMHKNTFPKLTNEWEHEAIPHQHLWYIRK